MTKDAFWKHIWEDKNYFYLADTDLFFHPEYFDWLNHISSKLNYKNNYFSLILFNIIKFAKLSITNGINIANCTPNFSVLPNT